MGNQSATLKNEAKLSSLDNYKKFKGLKFSASYSAHHGLPFNTSVVEYSQELGLLAAGSKLGILKVFGRKGVEIVLQDGIQSSAITFLAFGANRTLISVCSDSSIHIYTLFDQKCISVPASWTDCRVSAIAALKVLPFVFVATSDGVVQVLNLETGMFTDYAIHLDEDVVTAMCVGRKDGLVLGFENGRLIYWDIGKKHVVREFTFNRPLAQIECICCDEDGKFGAAGDALGNIAFFRMKTHHGQVYQLDEAGDGNLLRPIRSIRWQSDIYVLGGFTVDDVPHLIKLNVKDRDALLTKNGSNELWTLDKIPLENEGVDFCIMAESSTLVLLGDPMQGIVPFVTRFSPSGVPERLFEPSEIKYLKSSSTVHNFAGAQAVIQNENAFPGGHSILKEYKSHEEYTFTYLATASLEGQLTLYLALSSSILPIAQLNVAQNDQVCAMEIYMNSNVLLLGMASGVLYTVSIQVEGSTCMRLHAKRQVHDASISILAYSDMMNAACIVDALNNVTVLHFESDEMQKFNMGDNFEPISSILMCEKARLLIGRKNGSIDVYHMNSTAHLLTIPGDTVPSSALFFVDSTVNEDIPDHGKPVQQELQIPKGPWHAVFQRAYPDRAVVQLPSNTIASALHVIIAINAQDVSLLSSEAVHQLLESLQNQSKVITVSPLEATKTRLFVKIQGKFLQMQCLAYSNAKLDSFTIVSSAEVPGTISSTSMVQFPIMDNTTENCICTIDTSGCISLFSIPMLETLWQYPQRYFTLPQSLYIGTNGFIFYYEHNLQSIHLHASTFQPSTPPLLSPPAPIPPIRKTSLFQKLVHRKSTDLHQILSTTSKAPCSPQAQHLQTTEHLQTTLHQTAQQLHLRGEKLSNLEQSTSELSSSAQSFYDAMHSYNAQQSSKKWYQL